MAAKKKKHSNKSVEMPTLEMRIETFLVELGEDESLPASTRLKAVSLVIESLKKHGRL
jgi:hypothetical protein